MINLNIRSTQIDNNIISKTKTIQCNCNEIQKQFDLRSKKIDIILRIYKIFVKTYVDDIVVFNRILKKHVNYLRQIFQLLNLYDIRLSFKKSYFDVFFVALLNQKMNVFDLIITANKLAVIVNLKYFHTLKDLKIYLNFIE